MLEYGRRQVLGILMAEADPPDRETKPVQERVLTEEPLLTPLQLALCRWIAEHYLAPYGAVVRAMVPPGLLDRLELVVRLGDESVGAGERRPTVPEEPWSPAPSLPEMAELEAVLERVRKAPATGVPVRLLRSQGGQAMLLRRLRVAQDDGLVRLEWRFRPVDPDRGLVRFVRLTSAGQEQARASQAGEPTVGRPLGPRQVALLEELSEQPAEQRPAAELGRRHGASAITGLARRGLIELSIAQSGDAAPGSLAIRAIPADPAAPVERPLPPLVASVVAGRPARVLVTAASGAERVGLYLELVAAALSRGKGALILVPEIALVSRLVERFQHRFGTSMVVVHGALGDRERAAAWERIRGLPTPVVVGTRLAVLAPLGDLGLILVDEEHEAAYKADRTPRYQARDVALELGRIAGAPVVLISATPEVASVGRARRGELEATRLAGAGSGRPDRVEVLDLRAELDAGNRGLLGRELFAALEHLDPGAGERGILLLNRRGSASVVLCRDCGYVQVCPECQRPLVYHAAVVSLRCHHCGASAPIARRCPACGSSRIRYLAGGTERLEAEARTRLPRLRVARIDRDVADRPSEIQRIIEAFVDGRIDLLVGTSLLTRLAEMPPVALVGVVSADVALNLPDERASERAFQFLAAVVGLAAGQPGRGRAIVQTYQPEHPAIVAVVGGEAQAFYDAELASRELFGSPPYGSLIKLTVALEEREAAEAEGRRMADRLRARAEELAQRVLQSRPVAVLGPAPAYVARRAGRWRFNVVLRGQDPLSVLGGDPGAPWAVDVDPESLL